MPYLLLCHLWRPGGRRPTANCLWFEATGQAVAENFCNPPLHTGQVVPTDKRNTTSSCSSFTIRLNRADRTQCSPYSQMQHWGILPNCWILTLILTSGIWEDILLCIWTILLFLIVSLGRWKIFSSSWAVFGLLFSALFCAYSGAALANALSVVSCAGELGSAIHGVFLFVCFNCILIFYDIMLRKCLQILHVSFDHVERRMLQPVVGLVQILCLLNSALADSDNKSSKTFGACHPQQDCACICESQQQQAVWDVVLGWRQYLWTISNGLNFSLLLPRSFSHPTHRYYLSFIWIWELKSGGDCSLKNKIVISGQIKKDAKPEMPSFVSSLRSERLKQNHILIKLI